MLEKVRKLFGYTQEELGQKINVDQRYYTRIETGAVRSSAHIGKLAAELKIRESFLTFSGAGEYDEYPFLSDFYVFCLTDNKANDSYEFILKHICAKSEFIDILFLHVRSSLVRTSFTGGLPVMYIAMKNDRDTIFLFRRQVRTRRFSVAGARPSSNNREIEIKTFPRVESIREQLHALTPYVHDMTRTVSAELYEMIESGAVTRDAILPFFPGENYFHGQYKAHTKMKTHHSPSR